MAYLLSEKEYRDFREMRKMYQASQNNAGQRIGPARARIRKPTPANPLWCVVVDYDEVEHQKNSYSINLYPYFGAPDAMVSGVAARNSYEQENTASVRAGYTIVTSGAACGDIVGIEPIPLNTWHQVIDYLEVDGAYYYIFSDRNDPTIEE